MSKLVLDLSGRGGLVDGFYGDLNDTTAKPHRKYLGGDSEYADGIFNPLVRPGYISPANATFATVSGSTNALLIATEYDSINDDAFFAEDGAVIWRLDGLADTSLTADTTVAQGGTEHLTDLQIYELNGTRTMYYSYNITDSTAYNSFIGYRGLDSNSGSLVVDSTSATSETFPGTITAGGTYQKLAQSYTIPGVLADGDTLVFDKVMVPIVRGAADNAGYNVTIGIHADVADGNYVLDLESGSTQYAKITDASQTGLQLGDTFTLEAWVNTESEPGNNTSYNLISKWLTTGNQRSYRFSYENTSNVKYLTLELTSDGTTVVEATEEIDDNTALSLGWRHVSVTWDASTGATKFYINSEEQGSGSTLIPVPAVNNTDGSDSDAVTDTGNNDITNTTWRGRDVTINGSAQCLIGVVVDFYDVTTPDGTLIVGIRETANRNGGPDIATATVACSSLIDGENTIDFTIPVNVATGTYFVYAGVTGNTTGSLDIRRDNEVGHTQYNSANSGATFSSLSDSRIDIKIRSSNSQYGLFDGTAEFVIGSDDNESNPFDGTIDEVRVWNDVRTADELRLNFRTPLAGTEANLVAYYKFNNNYNDETSNNNDLTGVNTPTFVVDETKTALVHAPATSALASATINSNTIANFVTGIMEEDAHIYVDLSAKLTLDAEDMIFILVGPSTFGDMAGSDSLSWFGRDSGLLPNTDLSVLPGQDQQVFQYNGTNWEITTNDRLDQTVGNEGDVIPEDDFDFQLLLANSQTWSKDLAVGAIDLKYNATLFMRNADNGFMYIFEDNKVHKVDGTLTGGSTGSITEQVLRFPSYFTCVDAIDTRGRMYIGVQSNPSNGDEDARAYSESTVGVYIWDRQSTVFTMRDFVPLYGVRDIKALYVEPDGDVRAVCIGDDRFTQIRSIASGNGGIIERAGISAYPETRDSLKHINGGTVWLGADGIMYWHGSVMLGDPESLFKIGDVAPNVASTLTTGSILVGNSESTQSRQGIIFSVLDGSTRENYRWYPHGIGTISSVAQLANQGNVYSLVKLLPTLSNVRRMTLFMLPGTNTGSTTMANLKIYFNQSTTPWATKTVTLDDIKKGWKKIEINQTNVNNIQIEVEFSTTATLGTDDFIPMYAELVYDSQGRIENSG